MKNSRSFSRKDLEKVVQKVFNKPSPPRQIIMYAGATGMWLFNWALIHGNTLSCKYFTSSFKRVKTFSYFSLFSKSGIYKLKVTDKKFEFFKGTTLIHTINDVVNEWAVNSGNIYSLETKNKLQEVNKYIKYLEKL